MAALGMGGVVNASDIISVSPDGNRAGDVSRSGGGNSWEGRDGTRVAASSAEVAGWVAKMAPGQSLRVTPRSNGWDLHGPDGKGGEIVLQAVGYAARYDGRNFLISREGGGNLWRVARR